MASPQYRTFREFYPFYLSQHQRPGTRLFHLIGTGLGWGFAGAAIVLGSTSWLWIGLLLGYAAAWFSHAVFERNRPATFRYPLYSFLGDQLFLWEVLTGRQKIRP